MLGPLVRSLGGGGVVRVGCLALTLYAIGAAPALLVYATHHSAPPGQRIDEGTALMLYQFPPVRATAWSDGPTVSRMCPELSRWSLTEDLSLIHI